MIIYCISFSLSLSLSEERLFEHSKDEDEEEEDKDEEAKNIEKVVKRNGYCHLLFHLLVCLLSNIIYSSIVCLVKRSIMY